MRGKGSFEAGFKRGAIRGAAFGAIAAGVQIVLLGPAVRAPYSEDIEMANRAYGIGSYGPVYRRAWGPLGIVTRVFWRPGAAFGRNIIIKATGEARDVFEHETAHYYQQLLLSPTTWTARIITEQFIPSAYTTPGYLEWGAEMFRIY